MYFLRKMAKLSGRLCTKDESVKLMFVFVCLMIDSSVEEYIRNNECLISWNGITLSLISITGKSFRFNCISCALRWIAAGISLLLHCQFMMRYCVYSVGKFSILAN